MVSKLRFYFQKVNILLSIFFSFVFHWLSIPAVLSVSVICVYRSFIKAVYCTLVVDRYLIQNLIKEKKMIVYKS